MASISTQDFTTLVRNQVTAIQGAASAIVDFTIGSIMRAIVEANAAVALWLQALVLQVLALTRAATSSGADLDSWVGDYGLTRLAAVQASGTVTFARFTPTNPAFVPLGTKVQTADGTQQYQVVADTTNANYLATLGGYTINAGTSSIGILVQAINAAAATNASAGTITTLVSAVPGIDTVTNATGFTNGADAESDAALRIRFIAYVQSLSKATKGAIGYAITSIKQGLTYVLVENQQYNGTTDNGYFYVVVDDGTGSPGSTLLASIGNAIDAVRAASVRFGVFAPVVVTANIAMTATVASGYDPVAAKALVSAAITAYVNTLTIGQTLTYSRLAQVAYDASPGITNITGVTINSATADLAATNQQVIKTGTVTVS